MRKRTVADGGHAVRDGDGGEAAITERIFADGGHAVGDDDGGEVVAARERTVADGGHAVADDDGGDAAVTERMVADAGHRPRYIIIINRCRNPHLARIAVEISIPISDRSFIATRCVVVDCHAIIIHSGEVVG